MALQRTPLFDQHVAAGGKMVDFSGWELAVHYGSLMDEHHAVRKQAGMFDVSHMTVVDITGTDTIAFLRHLLANDINKISTPGGALYGCMLNHDGGVLDDLIVYRMDDGWCRVVVNAATRDKDIAWMQQQISDFDCSLTERDQLAMIAVQGPEARAHAHAVLGPDVAAKAGELKRFSAAAYR